MDASKPNPPPIAPDYSRLYRWLLLVASLLTTALLIAAALKENYLSEWQTTQRQYRAILEQKSTDNLGRGILRGFRIELKQITVPALNAVDRCVSCHTGIDDPRMKDLPQPFRTHSGNILAAHPADRFGCTVCHQGQGLATTYRDAAHTELEFWESPMLKGEYLQVSCAKCHLVPDFPGTSLIASGRALYSGDFSCNTCHTIRGEGGRDCPDLTFVGSKSVRTFDFSRLKGEKTRVRWLFEHFKNPQAVIPGSEMPNMDMSDEQAKALTVFMLSLTEDRIPVEYVARKPAPSAQAVGVSSEDSVLYENKGCVACHSFAGHGGTSGPDLTNLTVRRNADWLFLHFKDPGRTMTGAKNSSSPLTDAEANEITRHLLARKGMPAP